MDRDAIARERRRAQALEALEFEQGREAALLDQIGDLVTQAEGPRIDGEAFAKMAPSDIALVAEALAESWPDVEEGTNDDYFDDGSALLDAAPLEATDEEEIVRLQDELAACRRRQRAFQQYLDALRPNG